MSRAPSGRSVAAAAVSTRRTGVGTLRPSAASPSGSAVAAPRAPPTMPHSSPSPKALPAEGETLVTSLLPPRTAKASMSRPKGSPTTAAHAIRAAGRAPSVRCSCQRVATGDRADRDGDEDHRGDAPGRRAQRPGVDDGREQRADGLAEGLADEAAVAPDEAEDGRVGRRQRDDQAGDEHGARGGQRGEPGRDDAGHGQVPHEQLGELARLGIDAPDALAQRLGPRRLRPRGGPRVAAADRAPWRVARLRGRLPPRARGAPPRPAAVEWRGLGFGCASRARSSSAAGGSGRREARARARDR